MPAKDTGPARYFVGLFTAFWLCAWAVGELSVPISFLSGISHGFGPSLFMLAWWLGWTLGGLAVMRVCWRCFKSPEPEQLMIDRNTLSYDSGIPAYVTSVFQTGGADMWQNLFPKRTQHSFSQSEINSMKLRQSHRETRLTLDSGVDRIEIGKGLTCIEREWLYDKIRHNIGGKV